jgi:hypothetical protein
LHLFKQRRRLPDGSGLLGDIHPDRGTLEVEDFDLNRGFAPDANRFVERLQQPVAFVANMRDVDAAMTRRDLAERDQLLRRRVRVRLIDQAARQARSALLHRLLDQLGHALELRRRRRPVVVADDTGPDRSRGNQ